ncbi:hypothetical protein D3C81_1210680 [compost metagenome]
MATHETDHQTEADSLRVSQTRFSLHLHFRQRLANEQQVGNQAIASVGCIGQIAGAVAGAERTPQQFAALAHRAHPAHHEDRKAQVGTRFVLRKATAVDQIAAQAAKAVTAGIIAKAPPGNPHNIGVEHAGGVAITVLQAQVNGFAYGQAGEVRIRLQRRGQQFAQRIQCHQRGRILHQWQVDQLLDAALTQLPPDLLVFGAHLLIVRMRRPVDAALT